MQNLAAEQPLPRQTVYYEPALQTSITVQIAPAGRSFIAKLGRTPLCASPFYAASLLHAANQMGIMR